MLYCTAAPIAPPALNVVIAQLLLSWAGTQERGRLQATGLIAGNAQLAKNLLSERSARQRIVAVRPEIHHHAMCFRCYP